MEPTALPVAVQSEYTRGFIPYGVRNIVFLPTKSRRMLAEAPLKKPDAAVVGAPPFCLPPARGFTLTGAATAGVSAVVAETSAAEPETCLNLLLEPSSSASNRS